MPDNHEQRRNPDVAFEHSDIRSAAVVASGIGVLTGTLLAVGLLYFVFLFFRSTHPYPYRERNSRPSSRGSDNPSCRRLRDWICRS